MCEWKWWNQVLGEIYCMKLRFTSTVSRNDFRYQLSCQCWKELKRYSWKSWSVSWSPGGSWCDKSDNWKKTAELLTETHQLKWSKDLKWHSKSKYIWQSKWVRRFSCFHSMKEFQLTCWCWKKMNTVWSASREKMNRVEMRARSRWIQWLLLLLILILFILFELGQCTLKH